MAFEISAAFRLEGYIMSKMHFQVVLFLIEHVFTLSVEVYIIKVIDG